MPNPRLPKHWISSSFIQRLTREAHHQAWLLDKTSLTQKLRARCDDFRVELIFEGYATPLLDEALRLNLAPHHQAWLRTVCLTCQNQPVIYARSVIPHFDQQNPWWSLKQLGDQPLGEILFSRTDLNRSEFEFCQADWPQINAPQKLARRCSFEQNHAPLLLTEVFVNWPTYA